MSRSFMYLQVQCISSHFGQHSFVAFLFGTGVCTFSCGECQELHLQKGLELKNKRVARVKARLRLAQNENMSRYGCFASGWHTRSVAPDRFNDTSSVTSSASGLWYQSWSRRARFVEEWSKPQRAIWHQDQELKEDAAPEGYVGRLQYFSARCLFLQLGPEKNRLRNVSCRDSAQRGTSDVLMDEFHR